MLKRQIAIMVLGLGLAVSANAYGPCDEDEAKLCDASTHAETIKACLHKNVDRLSPECQAFVKSKDAEWQKTLKSWSQVQKVCDSEAQKHCGDEVKRDQIKAVQVCLMAEAASLSPGCKKELNRHIREYQPTIKPLP